MSSPVVPSPRAPVVDGAGRIQSVWFHFLKDLWERTGGFSDNVSGSNDDLDIYSSGDVAGQSQRQDEFDILLAVGREPSADIHALRQQVADNEILHSMGF
jgi:hypothetical protein